MAGMFSYFSSKANSVVQGIANKFKLESDDEDENENGEEQTPVTLPRFQPSAPASVSASASTPTPTPVPDPHPANRGSSRNGSPAEKQPKESNPSPPSSPSHLDRRSDTLSAIGFRTALINGQFQ